MIRNPEKQKPQNEELIKIGNKIAEVLTKYEVILVLLFAFALILKTSTNFPASIFITLILSTLAMLYYFRAFAVIADENAGGVERFVDKAASFASSLGLIGILFRLQNWPNSKVLIMMGSTTLIILAIAMLIIKSRKSDLKIFNARLIARLLIIAAIGLLLNFVPKADLVKFKLIKEVHMVNPDRNDSTRYRSPEQ